MSHWTLARKRFYGICMNGLSVQITCSYMMDDLDEDEEIDKYIAANLSYVENSAIGVDRTWFNCEKFRKMMHDPADNEIVHRVLDYFEDRDLGARDSYLESSLDDDDDDEFARYYLDNICLSYGWYLLKKKRQYLRLWLITNFWWKEAGINQHAENGRGRVRFRDEFETEWS